jgi:hypothetical protein
MSYPTDNIRLIFFLIVTAGLATYLFLKRKELQGAPYYTGLLVLSGGILALLISIVGICATEGHWDSDFILAFLSFKVVSPKREIGALYYLRAMGYSIVMAGIAILFGCRYGRSGRTK